MANYEACQVYLNKALKDDFFNGRVVCAVKEIPETTKLELYWKINVAGHEVLEIQDNNIFIQKKY